MLPLRTRPTPACNLAKNPPAPQTRTQDLRGDLIAFFLAWDQFNLKESLYEVDDKRRGRTVLWTNNEAVAQGGDQLLTVLMKSKRGMLPPCCRALRFEKKVVRRTEGEVLGCGREKRISAVLLPGCQQIGSESTLWWQMMMKGWPLGMA